MVHNDYLMKNTFSAVLLGIAILSSGFALYTFADQPSTSAVPLSSGALKGHITSTVVGPDGTVKQYAQTDNFILPTGEDCVLKYLFIGTGNTQATNTELCQQDVGQFNKIILLNGSSCASASTDTTFTDTSCTLITANGLAVSTVTVNDAATTPASGDTEPVVTLAASYSSITGLGASGNTVKASALTNSTSTTAGQNTLFAKAQTNGSTGVTVNNGDTLNITWTVTTGGTTTIDN